MYIFAKHSGMFELKVQYLGIMLLSENSKIVDQNDKRQLKKGVGFLLITWPAAYTATGRSSYIPTTPASGNKLTTLDRVKCCHSSNSLQSYCKTTKGGIMKVSLLPTSKYQA